MHLWLLFIVGFHLRNAVNEQKLAWIYSKVSPHVQPHKTQNHLQEMTAYCHFDREWPLRSQRKCSEAPVTFETCFLKSMRDALNIFSHSPSWAQDYPEFTVQVSMSKPDWHIKARKPFLVLGVFVFRVKETLSPHFVIVRRQWLSTREQLVLDNSPSSVVAGSPAFIQVASAAFAWLRVKVLSLAVWSIVDKNIPRVIIRTDRGMQRCIRSWLAGMLAFSNKYPQPVGFKL